MDLTLIKPGFRFTHAHWRDKPNGEVKVECEVIKVDNGDVCYKSINPGTGLTGICRIERFENNLFAPKQETE